MIGHILEESVHPMDCNDQFSEIFRTNVFCNLTDIQERNILSTYIQNRFCSDCQKNLTVNNKVFVHYVSLPQVVLAGYSMSDWPNDLISQNATHHL